MFHAYNARTNILMHERTRTHAQEQSQYGTHAHSRSLFRSLTSFTVTSQSNTSHQQRYPTHRSLSQHCFNLPEVRRFCSSCSHGTFVAFLSLLATGAPAANVGNHYITIRSKRKGNCDKCVSVSHTEISSYDLILNHNQ